MAEPSTPPRRQPPSSNARSPLTPEQVRRMEENRLRAKALRAQRDTAAAKSDGSDATIRTPSGFIAGQKRPFSSTLSSSNIPSNQRDASQSTAASGTAPGAATRKPYDDIQAARKFTQYVEYDFSKMSDTKGGFLTAEDDPHNKALHHNPASDKGPQKPEHMTLQEWERVQLLKRLRDARSGPFEPGLSAFKQGGGPGSKLGQGDLANDTGCRECGAFEIDWTWLDIFGCRVCGACKDKFPDKYSLLTKTEARSDYLLTDPELKDPELLPHLERPNPHKSTWNNMQLYLRFQVEEYAFSERRWGSAEALDKEFERREVEKKRRKEEKFKAKLLQLKKTTRTEQVLRRGAGAGAGEAQFGDRIRRRGERHEHEWGRTLTDAQGVGVKKCVECGMEVEELVL